MEEGSTGMTFSEPNSTQIENTERTPPIVTAIRDWRGWIAVAWVLIWGGIYLRTAVLPRLSNAIAWIISANH
jgi:hypothetical protein